MDETKVYEKRDFIQPKIPYLNVILTLMVIDAFLVFAAYFYWATIWDQVM